MTEKIEYKYSISAPFELKTTRGLDGKQFGSDSKMSGSIITIRFDNPKGVLEALNDPNLIDVICRVRELNIASASHGMKYDIEKAEFHTADEGYTEDESEPPQDPDSTPAVPDQGIKHNLDKNFGQVPDENGLYDADCEECGKLYKRKWPYVSIGYRKSKYQCDDCKRRN